MTRKKTSGRRGKSWKDSPALKLKSSAGLNRFDPSRTLGNRESVVRAMSECLIEGDSEGFLEILSAHLSTVNKARFARKVRIGRKTLYRVLDKTANPRLDTIIACVQAAS